MSTHQSRLVDRIGVFTAVPDLFILDASISHEAFRLFVVLRQFTNSKRGDDVAFPDYDTLKARTSIASFSTIAKKLRELEGKGWLHRRRRFGQSTVYTLTSPTPDGGLREMESITTPGVGQSYTPSKTNQTNSTRRIEPDVAAFAASEHTPPMNINTEEVTLSKVHEESPAPTSPYAPLHPADSESVAKATQLINAHAARHANDDPVMRAIYRSRKASDDTKAAVLMYYEAIREAMPYKTPNVSAWLAKCEIFKAASLGNKQLVMKAAKYAADANCEPNTPDGLVWAIDKMKRGGNFSARVEQDRVAMSDGTLATPYRP